MYDKVQARWKDEIKALTGRITATKNDIERERLKRVRDWMKSVEMAVVISEEADEEKKFSARKLNIKPHRDRMNALDANGHDIEHNFKDPGHPLQLVFVCAMWLTGFDAPTVSTLYLDKPMQGHTLMQTIARANRVSSYAINGVEKKHGEVVDYYNVFRRMKKALRDYAAGRNEDDEEMPVRQKAELFTLLDEALEQGLAYCDAQQVALRGTLERGDVFTKLGQFNDFANTLLAKEELRQSFNVYENTISSLYEACKPEVLGQGKGRLVSAFQYLRGVMDAIVEQANLDNAVRRIGELLDESVVVDNAEAFTAKQFETEYKIVQRGRAWDLSRVNVEQLREEFKTAPHRNIQIADLRAFLEKKLAEMLAQNAARVDFAQRLQKIIDSYNAGATSTENYYEQLTAYVASLQEEAERHVREGLSEDELELYDLLKTDGLSQDDEQRVKLAAKHLLRRLVEEQPKVLVQDWYKDAQTQTKVRSEISRVLNVDLPATYDRALFEQKCARVYDLVTEYSARRRKWAA